MGAFAAHALQTRLTPHALELIATASRYQFLHALALLALPGYLVKRAPDRRQTLVFYGFTVGTLLFSGSLYGIAFSEMRGLGFVTPVGGMLLLGAWLLLAWDAWPRNPS